MMPTTPKNSARSPRNASGRAFQGRKSPNMQWTGPYRKKHIRPSMKHRKFALIQYCVICGDVISNPKIGRHTCGRIQCVDIYEKIMRNFSRYSKNRRNSLAQ